MRMFLEKAHLNQEGKVFLPVMSLQCIPLIEFRIILAGKREEDVFQVPSLFSQSR